MEALEFIKQLEQNHQTSLAQSIILKLVRYFEPETIDDIPSIHVSVLDDMAIMIEWAAPDWRIGFSIEDELDESSWHLVSNEKHGHIGASGDLMTVDLDKLIQWLTTFANTFGDKP